MKKILFLLLFPSLALAQYQGNANQKITLGEQTTADGLVFRGVLNDTALITPLSDTSAYIILDTVNNRFYNYNRTTNVWSVAGGGTAVTSITGGTGLTGGTITSTGTLAADTSFLFTQSDTLALNLISRFATKQNNITLTTTGSSGAATLTGATLNIPQYSGGITDGDKGDIDVTNSGATWTIDTSAINLSENKVTGTLPVANGGTGASVRTFVDTINTQTVNGAKTFTSAVTATRFNPTANTVTGTGMYLPSSNALGLSTNGNQRMHITSAGDVGIGTDTPFDTYTNRRIVTINSTGTPNYGVYTNYGINGTFYAYVGSSTEFFYMGSQEPIPFIMVAGGGEKMRLNTSGEVWIGYTTDQGAYRLQINGTPQATGALVVTSDEKFKENITPLNKGLEIVNKLKPVTYNFISDTKNNFSVNEEVGFIAQDVDRALSTETFAKSIVNSADDSEPTSTMGLATQNLIPILVKAIQEQNVLIKALEQRILILENK